MSTDDMKWTLPSFLDRLTELAASYSLNRFRHSIAVFVVVPGERWEVEFMDDGSIEVERFKSSGDIFDGSAFDELFELAK